MSSSKYDFNNIAQKAPATGFNGTGMSRAGRIGTSQQGGTARPITSNKGAGFGMTNKFGSTAERFATTQKPKPDEQQMDPELRIKKFELEINTLIDESAVISEEGDQRTSLQKAKDASVK
jgi:intraflagellar transport protein 88